MREIALALRCRGHRVIARGLRFGAGKILVSEEKEELVFVLVESGRNVNRAADIAADGIVTVTLTRVARAVVKEGVRVESLVANVIVGQSVKIRTAALRHDVDDAPGPLSIFRLVVVE